MMKMPNINMQISKANGRGYKNPARYRLDFIKENTFNRIWSLRMTRSRVVLVTLACIMAFAALLWVVIAVTPLRTYMPGSLRGDIRARYIETALRLDSLEQAVAAREAYLSSIIAIMKGDVDTVATAMSTPATPTPDSLMRAGEAERLFVNRYEEENRFNLSVLAPIAAEGMIFASPLPMGTPTHITAGGGIAAGGSGTTPLASVYRGTVTGIYYDGAGQAVVVIQHPNDFVSTYGGLADVFVSKGSKVSASQRIGHGRRDGEVWFELWHGGSALEPDKYVAL